MFVGDRLAGIIYEFRGKHRQDHFGVVAIFRLLEDEGFCKHCWSDRIDLEARSEIKAEIKERLAAIANEKIKPGRRETTILPYLREVLGPGTGQCGSEDELAEYLLEPRETTLDTLVAVHKELCEKDKHEQALPLGEIIDLITPLQMPRELWDSVNDQIRRSRPLIENAAPGLVSAEVIAARIDATSQGLATPLGVSGGDDDHINYTHMIQERSTTYFPLKRPGTTMHSFVGDLYASQFGTDPGGELMSPEDKLARLRGDCRSWRNIHKRSRYIVVQLPSPTREEQLGARPLDGRSCRREEGAGACPVHRALQEGSGPEVPRFRRRGLPLSQHSPAVGTQMEAEMSRPRPGRGEESDWHQVVELGKRPDAPEQRHEFEKESILAIRAALAAGRPLLVMGEPGVGKTQLAAAAANRLRRPLVPKVVESRTESRDLLWEFDAVQRLAEAQVAGSLGRLALDSDHLFPQAGQMANLHRAVSQELRELLEVGRFVRPGPLWWGFDWADAKRQAELSGAPEPFVEEGADPRNGCVVLIDEIDKADSDVPNGLLESLGNAEFTPLGRQTAVKVGDKFPLVVVTTNEERVLPGAFLRRCLVLRLRLPVGEDELINFLVRRAQVHFPDHADSNGSLGLFQEAAKLLVRDRRAAVELRASHCRARRSIST